MLIFITFINENDFNVNDDTISLIFNLYLYIHKHIFFENCKKTQSAIDEDYTLRPLNLEVKRGTILKGTLTLCIMMKIYLHHDFLTTLICIPIL